MPAKPRGARAPRRKPRAYHHGDLRRALLDAALAIIEESGVSALSLREAARRVGVSHAAPAHHFGDLLGLLAAIAEEGFDQLRAHMLAAAAGPGEALRRYGVAYVSFATQNPARFRAMFHPLIADRTGPSTLRDAADRAFAVLQDGIRPAQAAGEVHAGDPRDLALAAWAPVHGLSALAVDRQLEGKGFSSRDPVKLAERLLYDLRGRLKP